jgi:hypothetical protein
MSDKLQFVGSLSFWERAGVRGKAGEVSTCSRPLPNPLPEGEGIDN